MTRGIMRTAKRDRPPRSVSVPEGLPPFRVPARTAKVFDATACGSCTQCLARERNTNSRLRLAQALRFAVAALVKARADLQMAQGKVCPRSHETLLRMPRAPVHSQSRIGINESGAAALVAITFPSSQTRHPIPARVGWLPIRGSGRRTSRRACRRGGLSDSW